MSKPKKSDATTQEDSLENQITYYMGKGFMVLGAGGGGISAFWFLLKEDDIPRAIASAVIGLAITYAGSFFQPIHKGAKKSLEEAGEATTKAFGSMKEQAVAQVLSMDERYFRAQATDCELYETEGTGNISGLYTLMMEDVFVPLALDRGLVSPGFCHEETFMRPIGKENELDIWQLLARVKQAKNFRQIVITAWGGFGKTTLLRHIAYILGKDKQGDKVRRFFPVLLLLRKYRDLLTTEQPEDLQTLIEKYHLKNIEGDQPLNMPTGWAEKQLKKGSMLVMLDGFDEVAKQQRPLVAKWLNRQMKRYPESTFILTSRPKAYFDQDVDQERVNQLRLPTVVSVLPFNKDQRETFVRKWYKSQEFYYAGQQDTEAIRTKARRAATELLEQIEARDELAKLASNPLLLTMIARFHRRYPSAELPKRRPELYQQICTLQIKDRPNARKLESMLPNCEAQDILQMLALEMMQRKEERLDKDLLVERLTEYLRSQDETVNPRQFLGEVEEISELLVRREEEYEFAHLSFQEFLAAMEVIRLGKEELLYEHFGTDWWKQTILLYVGKVKKPSQIIRAMRQAGATQLAYDCMQETTKRIDDDLKQDLEELLYLQNEQQQVTAERYQKLEQLLIEAQTDVQKWREADKETYRLMITAGGKEERQGFYGNDLKEFPCDELRVIDGLWVKYSNGFYGFGVQKEIYRQCGGSLDYEIIPSDKILLKFYEAVAWREYGEFKLSWDELLEGRRIGIRGHLPYHYFVRIGGIGAFQFLFSRCEL
ncbi:putative signal transduction protein with Nacht domain [[Leptolyngbya] sp. PCC 7376]|uniref:GUN4 domain-containing protein n=1 Tax=[Leptolyngbya] sp. PCC 7376 TaxID=111781 RepID=UPI00029F42CF|nr:GUN4 domain-containing protein [[Leptolyngbya] sp. PCC 7376]AFY37677.1 putative signal transduction protein with Nacht domain [[Leptolyngbya] sp. PCC 7376]